MSKPRTGQTFHCEICSTEFYRTPGQIRLGATKTCSRECSRKRLSGDGNPFWGKSHSTESKSKISKARKGKALGNQNASGYRHTIEARKQIGNASKKLWEDHRDKMLRCKPRGEDHYFHKPPELRRHRKHFSPLQKKEWLEESCAYCGSSEHLQLDHIIPIFDGGTNYRENAQTLCHSCNLWKVWFVDLPRYRSRLASKSDPNQSIKS